MSQLPSKIFFRNIGIIAGVVIVCIVGYRLSIQYRALQEQKKATKTGEVLVVGSATLQDSDGDGVPDYEERLFGTDPYKKNTFGIDDATYIAQIRYRLNKDTIDQTDPSQTNPTNTDTLAQNLSQTVAALYANNLPPDQNTIDGLKKKLGDDITSTISPSLPILTTVPNTPENILRFKTQLSKTIGTYPLSSVDFQFMQNPDGIIDHQIDFSKPIKKYTDAVAALKQIPVPIQYVTQEQQLVASYQLLNDSFTAFDQIDTDPATTLAALLRFGDILQTTKESFQNILHIVYNR